MSGDTKLETSSAAITATVRPPTPRNTGTDIESKPPPIPVTINAIYTKDDLLLHNKGGDLWLAIDGTVYDLTKFSEEHPGGKKILMSVAGTDASKKYRKYHGDNILQRYAKEYRIGTLRVEIKDKGSGGFLGMFRRRK
ncbi:cytochrome b5-like heme/steroid binding domain-containing protein [Aspergillus multicolor]|uniref:cytochrome b5-like heme/steroid binding domain-containing protein n=1 Tax=Aspergillus multicolor TaxID=41759 RepID=UPI003CCDFC2B